MTDPRPEFVLRFEKRGLFYSLFVLSVLFAAWFFVVLWGETEGFGDDPGRWALMPSFAWGIIGFAVLALFVSYCLAVLIIRERPGQVYRLEGVVEDPNAPHAPSFLQPQADPADQWGGPEPDAFVEETITETTTETVAEADPDQKSGQS